MRRLFCMTLLIACALTYDSGAMASETKSYSYDALGRLVQTTTTGTVNNNVTVTTSYDPTDNRTTYNVTGSTAKSVVVVPINGFTVIPISDN